MKINNLINYLKIGAWKLKIKRFAMFTIALGTIGGIFLRLTAPAAEAAWADDSYGYRVRFSFTHNAAISSPRAVTYTLDTAEIISAGLMQTDCDDIRFTDVNGKLLPHDLTGTCNNASTTFEIIFPSIVNGTNVAYVYYSNPSAVNAEIDSTGYTTLTPSGGDPSAQTDPTSNDEKGPSASLILNFDEGHGTTAQDNAQYNLDGTISGATWRTEDMCVSGKCLSFDGTDDVVTVAGTAISGSGTFSFWIKANSDGENDVGQIISKNNTFIRVDSEGSDGLLDIEASVDLATTDATLNISEAIVRNTWHHIALTISDDADDEISVYIDGKLRGTSTDGQGAPTIEVNDLLIGGSTSANFHGFIDEFRAYAYERSAAQILTDFSSRGSFKGSSAQIGLDQKSVMSNGLIGYWKTDESSWTVNCSTGSILDSSGNNLNGTSCPTTTGPTAGSVGKFGTGAYLDGSDDYLQVSDNSLLDFGSNDFSVAFWVNKRDSTTGGAYNDIFGVNKWNTGSGTNEWSLTIGDGNDGTGDNPQFYVESGSTSYFVDSNDSLSLNTWNHVVGLREGNRIKIYVNGKYQNATEIGNISINNASGRNLLVGAAAPLAILSAASFDEIRIYNRALSPREIEQLYDWAPGPVGHWKLDDNSGTSVVDSSGNSNAGTLTNDPTWTSAKFGNGVNFDGSNDLITVDSPAILDDMTTFTYSAWIYPRSAGGGNFGRIINKSPDVTFGSMWFIENDAGQRQLVYYRDTNTDFYRTDSSDNAITFNTWQHISVTVDMNSGNINQYVNGVLQSTSGVLTGSGGITSDGAYDLVIGNRSTSDTTRGFDGIIDEVKIYNYVRTPKQIIEDMNGGHPAGGSPIGSTAIYWSFDEMQGTRANNSNENFDSTDYGTINNSPTWRTGTNCKLNSCLDFASTESVTNARDPMPPSTTTNLTTSFWLKPDSLATSRAIVSKEKAGGTPERTFSIRTDSTTSSELRVFIPTTLTDTGTYFVTSGLGLANSTWTHIVMVYDGTQTGNSNRLKIYANGKPVSGTFTGTIPANLTNSATALAVGQSGDGTSSLDAVIDEYKLYLSSLSPSEVLIDMNAGSSMSLGGVLGTQNDEGFSLPAPAGWWKLDDSRGTTATDSSGNNSTITLQNNTSWQLGKIGNALFFDGSDDYAASGNTTVFDTGNAFTLSIWIKPTGYGDGGYPTFFTKDGLFAAYLTPANAVEVCQPGGSCTANTAFTPDGVVPQNTWSHIVITHNGSGSYNFYVNGQPQNSDTSGPDIANASQEIVLGADGVGTPSFEFQGYIDNVRVFGSVLNTAQIAYEYNRGAPVAHYQFDECQGSVLRDSSGNSLNATLTIGATGSEDTVGDCTTSSTAWGNGSSGKFNASISLDGTDDYATTANNAYTDIIDSQDFSISAWVNRSTFTTLDMIASNRNATTAGSPGYSLHISATNDDIVFETSDGTDEFSVESSGSITSSGWYHIVAVYDDDSESGTTIYINGQQNKETTSGTLSLVGSLTNGNTFTIGSETDGDSPFAGQIDDLQFFKYALPESQVKRLYNQSSSVRFGPLTGSP